MEQEEELEEIVRRESTIYVRKLELEQEEIEDRFKDSFKFYGEEEDINLLTEEIECDSLIKTCCELIMYKEASEWMNKNKEEAEKWIKKNGKGLSFELLI